MIDFHWLLSSGTGTLYFLKVTWDAHWQINLPYKIRVDRQKQK